VVSVFNGSGRNGLASATQDMLVQRGFVAGDTGNAPRKTDTTLILSSSPRNPAVQLVLRQFRSAKVARGRNLGDGVVVVVGESFRELRAKAVDSVKVRRDATICRATDSPS
jgi:hypothetical protein